MISLKKVQRQFYFYQIFIRNRIEEKENIQLECTQNLDGRPERRDQLKDLGVGVIILR
jgi:hypothetical protein